MRLKKPAERLFKHTVLLLFNAVLAKLQRNAPATQDVIVIALMIEMMSVPTAFSTWLQLKLSFDINNKKRILKYTLKALNA